MKISEQGLLLLVMKLREPTNAVDRCKEFAQSFFLRFEWSYDGVHNAIVLKQGSALSELYCRVLSNEAEKAFLSIKSLSYHLID